MDNYYIHEICRSRKTDGVFAKVSAVVFVMVKVGVSAAVVVFSGLFAGVFVDVFGGENT